jgi:Alcohol dehydrogenase GroES-like domain
VLGHEFSGTVVEVGSGVTSLAEGDRVAIEPVYRCDQCVPCRQGRYNVCAKVGFDGLSIDGGMAEFTVVDERMAHKLPDNVRCRRGPGRGRGRPGLDRTLADDDQRRHLREGPGDAVAATGHA